VKAALSFCALLAVVLFGCAGSFEEAKLGGRTGVIAAPTPTPYCVSLDDGHRLWGGVAKGAAVLAGAEGLSAIPIEDKTTRVILLSTGAAIAVVGGVAVYVAEDYAAAWARTCSQ
jgi:hypothetical protein